MPRTKLTFNKQTDNEIKGTIQKYRAIKGVNIKTLLKETDMARSTFYFKMKNPSSFTIAELTTIFNYLKVPEEERRIKI